MKKVKVSLTQRALKKIKNAPEADEKTGLASELARTKALDHVKLAIWTFNTQIFKNDQYLQDKMKELDIPLPQNDSSQLEFEGIDKVLGIKCYQDAVKACRSDLVLFLRKLLNEMPVKSAEATAKEQKATTVKETGRTRKAAVAAPLGGDKSFFMESLNADDSEVEAESAAEAETGSGSGRVAAFSDDEEEEEAYGGYLKGDGSDTETTPKRKKNRLGQVARRRMAEQKFGVEAKHIKSGGLTVQQREELRSQKSQQRKERLLRIKKDVAKASEFLKQKEASEQPGAPIKLDPKMHPSWAAKLQQQAKIQQATFQGQKIKFDE